MLRASEESGCPRRFLFWSSATGLEAFGRLVRRFGVEPHPEDLQKALSGALVGMATASLDLDERVTAAAVELADKIALATARAALHQRFVHGPQPARHGTYVGTQDRGGRELSTEHLITSPPPLHWHDLRQAVRQQRASGAAARLSAGVAQDSAQLA